MEKSKHKATIYFNMVRRGRWILLQDATGSFWGVYSSRESAKMAIPLLKKRWIETLRERGPIKPKGSPNEPAKKPD